MHACVLFDTQRYVPTCLSLSATRKCKVIRNLSSPFLPSLCSFTQNTSSWILPHPKTLQIEKPKCKSSIVNTSNQTVIHLLHVLWIHRIKEETFPFRSPKITVHSLVVSSFLKKVQIQQSVSLAASPTGRILAVSGFNTLPDNWQLFQLRFLLPIISYLERFI